MAVTTERASTRRRIDLALEGMTCAACAGRIEKALNGVAGVEATVNVATETATAAYDPAQAAPEDLVAAVEHAGYRAAVRGGAAAEAAEVDPLPPLRRRLVVSAVLGAPVVVFSMAPPLQFEAWQWVALALATPVVLWGGWPFHRAAARNLRHGAATMDTLISVGTLAAYGWSLAALIALGAGEIGMQMELDVPFSARSDGNELYLEVATAVTVLILLGRYLETRARRRAGAALRALLELGARDAHVLRGGEEAVVPIDELRAGDRFVVRPGEKVATDGVVEEGTSAVDESMLTGESMPVDVSPGSEVAGATLNTYGRLVVRATRVGAETALAQIARLVTEAQSGKAPVQRLADRVSAVFVPIVLAVAAGTLAFWLAQGEDATFALGSAVAVLVIACPCALGLATPTALLVGTARGAAMGVLIRGPEVLELSRQATTILLDKTGTVTQGRMELLSIQPLNGATAADVFRLAGAVEAASEHPVARAVAERARREVGPLPRVDEFRNLPGVGVHGVVEGHDVEVGRGPGGVLVRWDGVDRALLTVRDDVRPTSARAVAELKALGLTPVLVTGDDAETARRVADEVGIDRALAGVLPGQKAAEVRRLQGAGERVAMVGDGVNDAPALAQADLGIAIGTGTDVAMEASDLTLVSGDLLAAADAIRLARRVLRTIRGNLFWAFAYNVAAIPLAAAGYLNPVVAAAAMAASSLFVVSNSLRLRRFRSLREV